MYGELNEDVFADALKPALEALEVMKATNTDDPEEPVDLPSKAIEMVPHVFQVRGTDIAEQHVGDLQSRVEGHLIPCWSGDVESMRCWSMATTASKPTSATSLRSSLGLIFQ